MTRPRDARTPDEIDAEVEQLDADEAANVPPDVKAPTAEWIAWAEKRAAINRRRAEVLREENTRVARGRRIDRLVYIEAAARFDELAGHSERLAQAERDSANRRTDRLQARHDDNAARILRGGADQ